MLVLSLVSFSLSMEKLRNQRSKLTREELTVFMQLEILLFLEDMMEKLSSGTLRGLHSRSKPLLTWQQRASARSIQRLSVYALEKTAMSLSEQEELRLLNLTPARRQRFSWEVTLTASFGDLPLTQLSQRFSLSEEIVFSQDGTLLTESRSAVPSYQRVLLML